MKFIKRSAAILLVGFLITISSEFGEQLSVPGVSSVISDADARIGRPLTPVSYAGVARRTVRRCAVGVYRC